MTMTRFGVLKATALAGIAALSLSACAPAPAPTVQRAPEVAVRSADEPMVRAERRQVQELLAALGYPAGRPDGVVGEGTRSAIRAYQADTGRPTDGMLSRDLLAALQADADRLGVAVAARPAPAATPATRTATAAPVRRTAPAARAPAPAPAPAPVAATPPAPAAAPAPVFVRNAGPAVTEGGNDSGGWN